MIPLAFQSPQAFHGHGATIIVLHASQKQGGWRGLEVMLGEASWLDFPIYSLLGVDFTLQQWFSTRGDFSPRPSGHLAMPRTFLLVTAEEGDAIGI